MFFFAYACSPEVNYQEIAGKIRLEIKISLNMEKLPDQCIALMALNKFNKNLKYFSGAMPAVRLVFPIITVASKSRLFEGFKIND
jgi:hypothetical protein